jgi:hypothetical protein
MGVPPVWLAALDLELLRAVGEIHCDSMRLWLMAGASVAAAATAVMGLLRSAVSLSMPGFYAISYS